MTWSPHTPPDRRAAHLPARPVSSPDTAVVLAAVARLAELVAHACAATVHATVRDTDRLEAAYGEVSSALDDLRAAAAVADPYPPTDEDTTRGT